MKFFLSTLLLPLAMAITVTNNGDCPSSCVSIDGQCWNFVPERVTWNKASQTCHDQGAVLVSIFDKNRQTLLSELTGVETYWTGLNSLSATDQYVWDSLEEKPAVTLEESGYENWGVNQPENDSSKRCVADSRETGWTTRSCDKEQLPFICVQVKACQDPTYWLIDGQCMSHSVVEMTWKEASKSCHQEGAVLMSIFSKHIQQELDDPAMFPFWPRPPKYWTGLNSISKLGEFVWDSTEEPLVTLEESGYINWGANQPEIDIKKRCVVSYNGTWSSASCDEKYEYTCVKPYVSDDVQSKKTETKTRS